MHVKENQQKEIAQKTNSVKKKSSFIWLGGYTLVAVIAITFYILFRLQVFDLLGKYRVLLQKLSLAIFFAVVILSATKIIDLVIHKRSKGRYER